jgi:hypothetical protein
VQAPLPPDEEERLKALHRYEILYAGAPLITSDGHAMGMLCVTEWRAEQKTALQVLSRQLSCKTQPLTQKTARFSGRAAFVLNKISP